MASEPGDHLETKGAGKIDRILRELRSDSEELTAESALQKSEIIQEGMSDIAEVISGLEHLRQLLIKC